MAAPHLLSIRARPVLDDLPRIAHALESFALQHELLPAHETALQLMAEELFVNTVSHGGSDPAIDSVSLQVERIADSLQLTYTDAGLPFDSANAARPTSPPDPANIPSIQPGGLGLHFVAKLADSVSYQRRDGLNITTIIRRLLATAVAST